MTDTTLSELFTIHYGLGEYENKASLRPGSTPVISSKGTDNGCHGFYDVPVAYKPPIITVPRTGTIGQAFVQLIGTTPNSDCLVLVPRTPLSELVLFEVAQQIRANKWKYQYGRKVTPERLGGQKVTIGLSDIDYDKKLRSIQPRKIPSVKLRQNSNLGTIGDLFSVEYGQTKFENKGSLKPGNTALISSKGEDSGFHGFYDIEARYEAPFITVPRTGTIAKAYVQTINCSVDSNCLVLRPLGKMSIEEMQIIAYQIRLNKWRYMYGRQITPERLKQCAVVLPELEN